MQKRIILTEHSREVVEPGVQWVQQYPPFVSGIQLKPVPLDLSDTKQNFTLLNGHMQFGPVKEDTKNWSPIRDLVGGGTFAPPKIGSSESDNKACPSILKHSQIFKKVIEKFHLGSFF